MSDQRSVLAKIERGVADIQKTTHRLQVDLARLQERQEGLKAGLIKFSNAVNERFRKRSESQEVTRKKLDDLKVFVDRWYWKINGAWFVISLLFGFFGFQGLTFIKDIQNNQFELSRQVREIQIENRSMKQQLEKQAAEIEKLKQRN